MNALQVLVDNKFDYMSAFPLVLLTGKFFAVKIIGVDEVIVEQLICKSLEILGFLHDRQFHYFTFEIWWIAHKDVAKIIYSIDQCIEVIFENSPVWLVPCFEFSRYLLRVLFNQWKDELRII